MSYQALARKWRPRDFDAIVGQEHVVRALANAFERDRLHHAYLFSGTRGVGKTTIARIFAKCLNCERGPAARPCGECGVCREIDEGRHVDLIEVDAASRARVEETRDLLDNVQYAPVRARSKVYLIDEVHMFSRHSFNALLKTLEEPPPHVKFLLATTDPQRLPVTVMSRCLQFGLRRLAVEEIASELARIAKAEEIEADRAALGVLARAADGSMRDALSLLDQAAAYGAGRVAASDVRDLLGTVGRGGLFALFEALASRDAAAMIEALDRLAGEAADFEAVLGEVIESLGRMAALQAVPAGREDDEEVEALRGFARRISPEAIQLYYQIGLMGRRDLPYAPHPRGGFEMTMLRMAAFAPASDPADAPASSPAPPPPRAARTAPRAAPASPEPRETGSAPQPAAGRDPGAGRPPVSARLGHEPAGTAAALDDGPLDDVRVRVEDRLHLGEPDVLAADLAGRSDPAPPPSQPAPSADGGRPAAGEDTGAKGPAPAEPSAVSLPASTHPGSDSAPASPPPSERSPEERERGGSLSPPDWPEVCERLVLNGVTGQLARNCTVGRHSGGDVVLELRPEHAQLLNSGTRDALKAALSDYLGHPIRLRVAVADRKGESPAEQNEREENERVRRAAAELRAVPDYQDLLARFEGNVRSIRPPD